MKGGKILTTAVGATLLFSSSALAVRHTQAKGTLHLSEEVTVEGNQLVPGDYKIKTENNGPQTTVNIMQGKETIISVPAQAKPADINESHAYMITDQPNGTKELTAVYLKGTEYQFLDQNAPQPNGQ